MATPLSPLEALQDKITEFFLPGHNRASVRFVALLAAARAGTVQITPRFMPFKTDEDNMARLHSWDNCKQTATLVLVLAAPQEAMAAATVFYFNPRTNESCPQLAGIQATPSASLRVVVERALDAASKKGEVTVLGVDLVDVELLDRYEKGEPSNFQSFGHTFVIGIGPEGARIWQSSASDYFFHIYLEFRGARVRTVDELRTFVDSFENLVTEEVGEKVRYRTGLNKTTEGLQGGWTLKKNALYQRCFQVDINQICAAALSQRRLIPKFRSHVRVHVVENVKLEDVRKFIWKG